MFNITKDKLYNIIKIIVVVLVAYLAITFLFQLNFGQSFQYTIDRGSELSGSISDLVGV